MTADRVRLRRAQADDLPWLVALEQSPANARFLCAWPEDRHAAGLANADKRYLVVEEGEARCGFAILAGLRSTARAIEIVRVAVEPPGRGLGTLALRQLVDHAFAELGARRVFLDVFDDNPRARAAYRRLGFREEQVLRHAVRRQDGSRGTLIVMALAAGEAAAPP